MVFITTNPYLENKRNILAFYDLQATSLSDIKQFYTEYPHLHQLNRQNTTYDIRPQLLTAVACHSEPKEPVAIQFQTVIFQYFFQRVRYLCQVMINPMI
ncbi:MULTISPECIES: hypothetical protein [unclassified Flavobacterium]|uniref:hypothetical protein n=1 Tax=unclassified Flavobacterium TaxID=196869 RepID=UPI0025BB3B0E|nr:MULTISPECIES: hypothetical protein [unclassified Flavobacterium]